MSAAQNLQQHPVFVQAQNKVKYHLNQLDKELTKYPALTSIETRTQIPKTYLVLATLVLLAIFHLITPVAAPVSYVMGFALPAYLSLKALESPGHSDDVQWITYWVVFASLGFVETFAMGVVLYYLPWYFVIKTVFLLWLQLPAFRGGYVTYNRVIKPLLLNSCASSRAAATPDTLTDNLRDRVNTATTE
ncbi:TB2/DP1, HVA22 family-domain-containing protein [Pisolithus thermaeus]|nr:TB2/DP1, HVA22 family-domain-containing protein [Pisolithus croceorrhizus]KAI6159455.1 TB2/DP1, HVA22 family-domain-containing protein [Pisolithus thermaeus]